MNYYESVVVEYLRADRAVFVNTEYCIQLNANENPDTSGPHWYCDAVALDFRSKTIFLCEISYAVNLQHLLKRLRAWNENWQLICSAIARDSCFCLTDWTVRPWLFIPEKEEAALVLRLQKIANGKTLAFDYHVTHLEIVQPWRYSSYNRKPLAKESL